MIKSITILGGGTAGFISTLILRATYPKLDIKLIESSQYGIIGVGEGSTEHWAEFMKHCGIDVCDLIRETGATFKTGIKFQNWNGDQKEYYHSLSETVATLHQGTGIYPVLIKMIADGDNPLNSVLSRAKESLHAEPLHRGVAQFHFDTNKLNKFFHKLCLERNITIIDDTISEVVIDNEGFVSELIGEAGTYTSEFFIDCSGFRRIINKKLNVGWVDCSEYLPMNSALAAQTPYEENIPSHTVARALSAGWMWRIPTQERFGNGYVYCDKFISDEEAEKEFKSQFPYDIQIGKKIKFGAGYVDQFWVKNCVSAGLAGLFVEPLEATSIGATIQQMFGFCSNILYWSRKDDSAVKRYNTDFERVAKNIIDFVQLHYITKRDDSKFWKWNKDNLKLTPFNKQNLERFKTNLPGVYHFNYYFLMFKELNYMQVMQGLELFDVDRINELYYDTFDQLNSFVDSEIADNDYFIKNNNYVSHREAINILLDRYFRTDVHL